LRTLWYLTLIKQGGIATPTHLLATFGVHFLRNVLTHAGKHSRVVGAAFMIVPLVMV
jgi:hypothetical protein